MGHFAVLLSGFTVAISMMFGQGLAAEAPDQSKGVRIAVVASPEAFSGHWARVRDGMNAAAGDRGVDLSIAESSDLAKVVSKLIDDAGERPFEAMVLGIDNIDAAPEPVAAARDAGLPLITMGAGYDISQSIGSPLHVGLDDFDAGRKAGIRLREVGADSGVCVLPETGHMRSELRCQGVRAGFGLPIDIIALSGEKDAAERRAKSLREKRSAGDFIAFAQASALAAATARIAGEGETRVRVAAFDPDEEFIGLVAAGSAEFGIGSQPELQGYLAISLLVHSARTGDIPVSNVATGPQFIDQAAAQRLIPPPPEPVAASPSDSELEIGEAANPSDESAADPPDGEGPASGGANDEESTENTVEGGDASQVGRDNGEAKSGGEEAANGKPPAVGDEGAVAGADGD